MPDQERRKTMENKVLDKRIDMLGFIKVEYANPNGNPGEGNEPRMLLDGTGYMTDVSLKYKIRDWIEKNMGTVRDLPGLSKVMESRWRQKQQNGSLSTSLRKVLPKTI